MTYLQLAYLHLCTVVLAFVLGTFLMLQKKGTQRHRLLGKCYMTLMLVTATIALCMPAQIGPRFLNHFGYIHLFCLLVFYAVPAAYFAIRQGNLVKHKANMLGVYVGGILIAGAFAFLPGRLLHDWFF